MKYVLFISRNKHSHPLDYPPFYQSKYYSLRQWTVQSITVDCTVYYGGLYSPLPETVVIFRLKALDRQQETT